MAEMVGIFIVFKREREKRRLKERRKKENERERERESERERERERKKLSVKNCPKQLNRCILSFKFLFCIFKPISEHGSVV